MQKEVKIPNIEVNGGALSGMLPSYKKEQISARAHFSGETKNVFGP